ncbi:MAG TPA: AI-2E family transporter, partial [Longimicrobiales bacterium]
VLYAGIQLIETNVLTPLVMKKTVHVPPALSILFQTLMAIVFGFLGLLLAVPILAATLVLINRLDFQADMRQRNRTKAEGAKLATGADGAAGAAGPESAPA